MAELETDFLQPDEERDFALIIEGTKVYVDRYYLAKWSPVLRKIFYPQGASFKQPDGGMEMKEKKLDDFLIFLHAVFPTDKTLVVNESNVGALVAYADEYDVAVLRDHCVKFMGDQLKESNVSNNTLIEYLRLASLYSLNDLQKQLVPRVAKLSVQQITAAHGLLPAAVLSAVYQSKALVQQTILQSSALAMPKNAFMCRGCMSTTCAISKGASSCCGKGVFIHPSVAALIEAKCEFTCIACSKPCCLKSYIFVGIDNYHLSTCCGGRAVFVYARWEVSRKRSADTAADGPSSKATDFSADLLDRNQ